MLLLVLLVAVCGHVRVAIFGEDSDLFVGSKITFEVVASENGTGLCWFDFGEGPAPVLGSEDRVARVTFMEAGEKSVWVTCGPREYGTAVRTSHGYVVTYEDDTVGSRTAAQLLVVERAHRFKFSLFSLSARGVPQRPPVLLAGQTNLLFCQVDDMIHGTNQSQRKALTSEFHLLGESPTLQFSSEAVRAGEDLSSSPMTFELDEDHGAWVRRVEVLSTDASVLALVTPHGIMLLGSTIQETTVPVIVVHANTISRLGVAEGMGGLNGTVSVARAPCVPTTAVAVGQRGGLAWTVDDFASSVPLRFHSSQGPSALCAALEVNDSACVDLEVRSPVFVGARVLVWTSHGFAWFDTNDGTVKRVRTGISEVDDFMPDGVLHAPHPGYHCPSLYQPDSPDSYRVYFSTAEVTLRATGASLDGHWERVAQSVDSAVVAAEYSLELDVEMQLCRTSDGRCFVKRNRSSSVEDGFSFPEGTNVAGLFGHIGGAITYAFGTSLWVSYDGGRSFTRMRVPSLDVGDTIVSAQSSFAGYHWIADRIPERLLLRTRQGIILRTTIGSLDVTAYTHVPLEQTVLYGSFLGIDMLLDISGGTTRVRALPSSSLAGIHRADLSGVFRVPMASLALRQVAGGFAELQWNTEEGNLCPLVGLDIVAGPHLCSASADCGRLHVDACDATGGVLYTTIVHTMVPASPFMVPVLSHPVLLTLVDGTWARGSAALLDVPDAGGRGWAVGNNGTTVMLGARAARGAMVRIVNIVNTTRAEGRLFSSSERSPAGEYLSGDWKLFDLRALSGVTHLALAANRTHVIVADATLEQHDVGKHLSLYCGDGRVVPAVVTGVVSSVVLRFALESAELSRCNVTSVRIAVPSTANGAPVRQWDVAFPACQLSAMNVLEGDEPLPRSMTFLDKMESVPLIVSVEPPETPMMLWSNTQPAHLRVTSVVDDTVNVRQLSNRLHLNISQQRGSSPGVASVRVAFPAPSLSCPRTSVTRMLVTGCPPLMRLVVELPHGLPPGAAADPQHAEHFEILRTNYRPPSHLGKAIPTTENIYNADPSAPKYMNRMKVSQESGTFKQCAAASSRDECRAVCAGLPEGEGSSDCIEKVVRVDYRELFNPSLIVHREGVAPFPLAYPYRIEEVNGRTAYCVNTSSFQCSDKEAIKSALLDPSNNDAIQWEDAGLFHFRVVVIGDTFCTLSNEFVVFVVQEPMRQVVLWVVVTLTVVTSALLLFVIYLCDAGLCSSCRLGAWYR